MNPLALMVQVVDWMRVSANYETAEQRNDAVAAAEACIQQIKIATGNQNVSGQARIGR